MEVPLAQRLLTVDDYLKMVDAGILTEDDRVELLEGKIIEMSPAGKRHVAMVIRLTALFNRILGEKTFISIQNPLAINRYSMPEPDVAILKSRSDFYENALPQAADAFMVIEIADSSLDKDRRVKSSLYASAGIPEYWIIDLEQNEVEVCRKQEGEHYRSRVMVRSGEEIGLEEWGLTVRWEDLFGS